MKKRFFNILLVGGALLLSSAGFVACNNDDEIDDLKTRLTVVEGMIGELQAQLQNAMVTGATVTEATKAADGTWTITLSDGKQIVITPSVTGGGGGSSVTVTDNGDNLVITVAGTDYVLPKGATAVQLIYSPQYDDGMELIEDIQPVNLQFFMEPALTAEQLASATIEVNEAHVLATRADSRLFKIAEGASIDGNMLTVPFKALEVEAGKTYAVSLKVTAGSKTFISNYFRVKIADTFSFIAYEPMDIIFADAVKSTAAPLGEGQQLVWTVTLPLGSGYEMVDDFNFNSLITNVPEGATFEIGSDQNSAGRTRMDLLRASLKPDGSWSLAQRPGTAFNPDDADVPNGVEIVVIKDDVIKMKVYFQTIDPLAGISFKSTFVNLSEHMEICPEDGSGFWAPGVNSWDIQQHFTAVAEGDDSAIPLQHGPAANFLKEQWSGYTVTLNDEGDVIYNDGHLRMGEIGKKYAKASRGVYWYLGGAAVTSSNRRNIVDMPEAEADKIARFGGNCNGEIIQGWDWIPYADWHDLVGVDITPEGILTTNEGYPGWGLRIHARAAYEYAYGERYIGDGDGGIAFLFINRRGCAEGVVDPAAR